MDFLEANGRRIAYRRTDGTGPGVVFLGGFKSDMDGTKAIHLESWAQAQGRESSGMVTRRIARLGFAPQRAEASG